jgi:transcriptional regulator with XRE-family HTH domain
MKKRRLKVLRAEHDYRQSDVANRAGLSVSRYQQIENGDGSVPRDEERAALAVVFGVRASDIDWPVVQQRAVAS